MDCLIPGLSNCCCGLILSAWPVELRTGRGYVCVNIDATASASTSAGPGGDARAGRVGGCVDTVSVVSSIRPAGVEIVWLHDRRTVRWYSWEVGVR